MTTDNNDAVIVLGTHIAGPLCFDLGVLEDWLLHCSLDTWHELAEFAYYATGSPQFGVSELVTDLGRYGVILQRLLAEQSAQR